MSARYFLVNVFTQRARGGNPLAVVVTDHALAESCMKTIAAQVDYSETAFVAPRVARNGGHDMRIFTPAREISFAGHPVLGAAWVLRHFGTPKMAQSLALNLPMGRIHVDFEVDPDEGERAWFVAPPAVLGPTCPPDTLADAVGIAAADVDALRGPAQQVSAGVSALIVPVHDLQALRRCTVGADALTRLAGLGWPSLIYFFCFQTHRPENDVCARFFFDAHGVREDPATGNGASFLGAYLLEHGPLTKACLRIEQGHHVGRPSLVLLRTDRVAGGHEVKVGGSAAFVSREEAARVERMLSSPSMARLGLQPGPQDLRSRSASVRPEEFLRYSMTIRGK